MAAPQAETAVLFGDIRDFTSYTASVGDAQAYTLARTFAESIAREATRHSGRLVKTYGDGAMAEFPRAPDAVHCAVALHRALSEHNDSHPQTPIAAGVGIAWGQPIQEGGDLFGHSVNLAKRLADQARGGQIVVCPEIRDRCLEEGPIRFLPLGELSLKGLPPQLAFEAAWREELARLSAHDEGLMLILTRDKLVVELSKATHAKLQQAQARIKERAEQRGLAGFLMRRLQGRLPEWIDRALERAGIGLEHDLNCVELAIQGQLLTLRITGRKALRLDRSDFDAEQARLFVDQFKALRAARS